VHLDENTRNDFELDRVHCDVLLNHTHPPWPVCQIRKPGHGLMPTSITQPPRATAHILISLETLMSWTVFGLELIIIPNHFIQVLVCRCHGWSWAFIRKLPSEQHGLLRQRIEREIRTNLRLPLPCNITKRLDHN
jgi:hypothetical protein